MTHYSPLKHHADLVDRMAESRGVDLEEAVFRGALRPTELGDAVLACSGCAHPERCATWLEAQTQTAPSTPDYCRNSALFDALLKDLNK